MQTRDAGPTLDYITRTFVREPEWIVASRAEGEARRPGMQISAYEGHLLQWLVRISGAKNILEVGTFMGSSAMWMAGGLSEDGHVTSLEFDRTYAEIALTNIATSPVASRITVVPGDAHAWINATPATPQFDLVFIDAEKSGYATYLDEILPRMHPRGWIVGDNTLLFGAMAGEAPSHVTAAAKKSMTRFNETLADATRFESLMLPTPEGLTVARMR